MSTTAVIVNYHCARLTAQAVRSLPTATERSPLTAVVVDNSSDDEESHRLRSLLPPQVHLLMPAENIGFARASNLAWRRFPGRRLLLLNPDARLLPGCLHRLERTLAAEPRAGAVSPRIFWDDEQRFLMPPTFPVALFLFDLFRNRYAPVHRLDPLLGRCWRAYAWHTWRTETPYRVSNLAGAVVLMKAEAVNAAGGLFDPRFFLYFEDSDLFLRMRKAGRHLLVEPRARAVHLYDQSAPWQREMKRSHLLRSRRRFIAKHFPRLLPLLEGESRAAAGRSRHRPPEPAPAATAGNPLTLEIPGPLRRRWIFEWSPHPDFIPAVACFGRGPLFRFSPSCWHRLLPGNYFGRIGGAGPWARAMVQTSWQIPQARKEPGGEK